MAGRSRLGEERQLEAATAWLGNDADGGLGNLGAKGGGARGWDQFATNEQLTGQRSTYSDELYTTKLQAKDFTGEQASAVVVVLPFVVVLTCCCCAHVLLLRSRAVVALADRAR